MAFEFTDAENHQDVRGIIQYELPECVDGFKRIEAIVLLASEAKTEAQLKYLSKLARDAVGDFKLDKVWPTVTDSYEDVGMFIQAILQSDFYSKVQHVKTEGNVISVPASRWIDKS